MNLRHKITHTLVLASLITLGLGSGVASAAGSASYRVSPGGGSHAAGSSWTVSIYENSGAEPVNAVQADFSYDASKIRVVSVSTGAFSLCGVSPSASSNTISCATPNAVTGNQLVGRVTLRALVNSGTASFGLAQSSMIVSVNSSSDVWNHANVAGTYAMTVPAPAPTPATPAPEPAPVTPTPEQEPTPVVTAETVPESNGNGWKAAAILTVLALIGIGTYFISKKTGTKTPVTKTAGSKSAAAKVNQTSVKSSK